MAAVLSGSVLDQNGPNDHFGQTDLIPNWNFAFARPKWTKLVHFSLKRTILVHLGPPTVLWPFLSHGIPQEKAALLGRFSSLHPMPRPFKSANLIFVVVSPSLFTETQSNVQNAPTCYRAPKWPNPEFPRKIPEKYPPARNSGLPEFTPKIARKYRKNDPKIEKMGILVFWGYFFGIFLVFQNFGPRGIFLVFFVEIPGRAISGLCSRSGRS